MQKYTQEDFENFEVIDGLKICPKGDYTEIKKFPGNCSFEKESRFGPETQFDGWCDFGQNCIFGEDCRFGKRCYFKEGCHFEEGCYIGRESSIEKNCCIENCIIDETCFIENGRPTPFEILLQQYEKYAAKEQSHDYEEELEL